LEELKQKIRVLEEDCATISKERERLYEEKHIIDKRNKIEQESLKKRITMHEEFAKQQEEQKIDVERKMLEDFENMKRSNEEHVQ
jgi:hypothetical protein